MAWHSLVPYDRLPIDRGVCVLVAGSQVALVRTSAGQVHAVDNLDPISGAMVMSRGLVGTRGDLDVLISPMHKQAYVLTTGECLDAKDIWLQVHDVRVRDGIVEVGLAEQQRQPA